MNLTRIGSNSIPSLPHSNGGRCVACAKPIRAKDRGVCLYGDLFHRECAFHTPRRKRTGDRR